jgi:hypothetical protein
MNPIDKHLLADAKVHFLKCNTTPFQGPGNVFQRATASTIAAATVATLGYRAASYQGIVPAGCKAVTALGAEAVAAVLGAEAVVAVLGAAALVEAAAPGAGVLGAAALGAEVLGGAALVAAALGAAALGAAEFILNPCISGVVGRRRAYGCHFHEFPHSQQQALFAL